MGFITKMSILALLSCASALAIGGPGALPQVDCAPVGPYNITYGPAVQNNVDNQCGAVNGKTLDVGKSFKWWGAPIDGKTLVYHVKNSCLGEMPINKTQCEGFIGAVIAVCGNSLGQVTSGNGYYDDCLQYGLTVIGPGQNPLTAQDKQARATSTQYCSGGHGIPISEFRGTADRMCLILNGQTVSAGQSTTLNTRASYGDLTLTVTNGAGQAVVVDASVCQAAYNTIASDCSSGSNFTSGAFSNGATTYSAAILANGAVGGRAVSPAKRAAPNNCPAGVSSPYPGDVTHDAKEAIAAFLLDLSTSTVAPGSIINRDIPLANFPSAGPVHFTFKNVCSVSQIVNLKAGAKLMGDVVDPMYNLCEFIAVTGYASGSPCQYYDMLVGDI